MGRMMLFQLPAASPEKLADFYCLVFGWTKKKMMETPSIWAVYSGKPDAPGMNGSIFYKTMLDSTVEVIDVPSLDAAIGKITELGGIITSPKSNLPRIGAFAWFKDSDGNQMVLMERAKEYFDTQTNLAPEGTPDLGILNRPCHFEIPGTDPGKLAEFYHEAFGWKVIDISYRSRYYSLLTGDPNTAGIDGGIVQRSDGMHPFNSMAVADLIAAQNKIRNNGGTIELERQIVPGIGVFSSCLDIDGNQFGIIQFDKPAK